MEATKVISGVQGVFSDSVSKFKSPRMANIIYIYIYIGKSTYRRYIVFVGLGNQRTLLHAIM